MKSKYLALGLSVVLTLSLVSCGGQQAQEPQEPAQDIQQAEPVTTEPTAEPMEVKQEVKTADTQSAPVEGEQDTDNEVDPAGTAGEAEPVEPAESPQEVTPTEPSKADTEPQQSQETVTQQQTSTPQPSAGGSVSLKDTAEQQGVQVTEQAGGSVWDQAFYDTLNPQQQEAYKNADDATRTQMKSIIESNHQMDQQGYQGGDDLTQDEVRDTWGNIIVN